MGKFIGLLVGLVCIWAALEVYNEGVSGAFGGALAQLEDGESAGRANPQSVPKRAGAAVERAHAAAEARRDQLMGD